MAFRASSAGAQPASDRTDVQQSSNVDMPNGARFGVVKCMVNGEVKCLYNIDKCKIQIGRQGDIYVYLKEVSRRHCTLQIDQDGTMWLINHSPNGTRVHGASLKPDDKVCVESGDCFSIEYCSFELLLRDKPAIRHELFSAATQGSENSMGAPESSSAACIGHAQPTTMGTLVGNEQRRRRTVTFGPSLEPEIFARDAPPNAPVRRGERIDAPRYGQIRSAVRKPAWQPMFAEPVAPALKYRHQDSRMEYQETSPLARFAESLALYDLIGMDYADADESMELDSDESSELERMLSSAPTPAVGEDAEQVETAIAGTPLSFPQRLVSGIGGLFGQLFSPSQDAVAPSYKGLRDQPRSPQKLQTPELPSVQPKSTAPLASLQSVDTATSVPEQTIQPTLPEDAAPVASLAGTRRSQRIRNRVAAKAEQPTIAQLPNPAATARPVAVRRSQRISRAAAAASTANNTVTGKRTREDADSPSKKARNAPPAPPRHMARSRRA